MTTYAVSHECAKLRAAWREALEQQRVTGTDQADAEEQRAYDELVDFIEAHDLNYTAYDPRGPKEQQE